MKPFNLEKAMAGEPCVTRDGKAARVLGILKKNNNETYPLVVAVMHDDNEISMQYDTNGKYDTNIDSIHDLFMAPKTRKLWIAIDKKPDGFGAHSCTMAVPENEKDNLTTTDRWLVEVEVEE